jgi:hypothetical protein
MKRRDFIHLSARAGSLALLAPALSAAGAIAPNETLPPHERRKLIVVLFGGGTRCAETIDDPEHRFIPRLWREMIPHGALFTNMRVEGKVVHPNSAGSIVTGHWEWDDLDWSHPVDHPTLFEIFRRERARSDTAVWSFVYASILAKMGESRAAGFGADYGANVLEPPTIPRRTAEHMDWLLRSAAAQGNPDAEWRASVEAAQLVRASSRITRAGLRSPVAREFLDERFARWQESRDTTSHDAFLAESALQCMKDFAPDVLFVAFGEIDCAHYGSWSRYTDAIRRTDELTWRLWRAANESPEYRGRTLFLVLPDHGREMDSAGGTGFIHHSDFYTASGVDESCRRVWMLALGPGVPNGVTVSSAAPITTVAATGLEYLGLRAATGAAPSAWPALRQNA